MKDYQKNPEDLSAAPEQNMSLTLPVFRAHAIQITHTHTL